MNKKTYVYIGTYTSAGDTNDGIYILSFDSETGEIKKIGSTEKINNPSYLCASGNYLYAVMEEFTDGGKSGGVAAYKIDAETGLLHFSGKITVSERGACHLDISEDKKYLAAANYGEGSVSLIALNEDGSLGELLDITPLSGAAGPNKKRQEKSHAHYAMFRGEELFISDLGTDTVFCFNTMGGKLWLDDNRSFAVKPGAGPRHLDQRMLFIYCANELTSDVSVFKDTGGIYNEVQTISMLPADFVGENTAAAIHLSADNKYLYASNRGHDSIACYRVLNGGTLVFTGNVMARGKEPRDFSLSADDKFLIIANQNSNSLDVFKREGETYVYAGYSCDIPKPVCVKFHSV